MSQSHKMDSSRAFLSSPFLRFVNVTDRLRSSGIRSILIFFLPMTTLRRQASPLHCCAGQPPGTPLPDDRAVSGLPPAAQHTWARGRNHMREPSW